MSLISTLQIPFLPFDGDDQINSARKALPILHEAAESRGTSRYDLPLGPLHLLQPMALWALAFPENENSTRCVTLWAYILYVLD